MGLFLVAIIKIVKQKYFFADWPLVSVMRL